MCVYMRLIYYQNIVSINLKKIIWLRLVHVFRRSQSHISTSYFVLAIKFTAIKNRFIRIYIYISGGKSSYNTQPPLRTYVTHMLMGPLAFADIFAYYNSRNLFAYEYWRRASAQNDHLSPLLGCNVMCVCVCVFFSLCINA